MGHSSSKSLPSKPLWSPYGVFMAQRLSQGATEEEARKEWNEKHGAQNSPVHSVSHSRRATSDKSKVTASENFEDDADNDTDVDHRYTSISEGENIRTEPPRLNIVHGNEINVRLECMNGEWNHTDYVSLSERIFCDMQSRTIFPLCTMAPSHPTCFNISTKRLETKDAAWTSKRAIGYSTSMANMWTAIGPMPGYQYTSITHIG